MTNNGEFWYDYHRVNNLEAYQVPSIVFTKTFADDLEKVDKPVLFPFIESNKLVLSGDVRIEPSYSELKDEETVLGRMIVPVTIIAGDKVLTYKGKSVFEVSEVIPDSLLVRNAPNSDYHMVCISSFVKNIFLGVDGETVGVNSALIDFGTYVNMKEREAGYYSVVTINETLFKAIDTPEDYEWVENKELIADLHDVSIKFDK
jgi:hypothetical protein